MERTLASLLTHRAEIVLTQTDQTSHKSTAVIADGVGPAVFPVRLRPLSLDDRAAVRRWMADDDVVRFTVMVPSPDCAPVLPYGPEAADRYLRALMHDAHRRSYAIEAAGVHVGNVGLKEIDLAEASAEVFIEIGERAYRGRGVAKAAMAALLDEAMFVLGLVDISLGVFEFNHAARHLYERLGFVDDGHYGWHFVGSRVFDVRRMRIGVETWVEVRERLGL